MALLVQKFWEKFCFVKIRGKALVVGPLKNNFLFLRLTYVVTEGVKDKQGHKVFAAKSYIF